MPLNTEQSHLPTFLRFADLKKHGIVDSRTQLYVLIDHCGFPQGRLISPNIRAWTVGEIEQWLSTRPTALKPAPIARGRPRKIPAPDKQAAQAAPQ
jgi:predicted DNA-binding transcriptional regulator AlpA